MAKYGDRETIKQLCHVTGTNRDNYFDNLLLESEDMVDTWFLLLTGSEKAFQSNPPILDRIANEFAVGRHYFYENPNHPTEGFENAKSKAKDFIKANYAKITDEYAHKTFLKTTGNVRVGNGL